MSDVEVELPDGAGVLDIISALRRKVPALEGPVIRDGENRLHDTFGFNINGRFYLTDDELEIREGDSIALLTLATAG